MRLSCLNDFMITDTSLRWSGCMSICQSDTFFKKMLITDLVMTFMELFATGLLIEKARMIQNTYGLFFVAFGPLCLSSHESLFLILVLPF